MNIHDACIPDPGTGKITLWKIRGAWGLYPTKIVAEETTRAVFPNEDADARYSRISFVEYYDEATVNKLVEENNDLIASQYFSA